MDNGQHNVGTPNVHNRLEPINDDFNDEQWQRSLEISTPVGMPSPEQLSSANLEKAPENPDSLEVSSTPAEATKADYLEVAPLDQATATSELGQITPLSTPNASNQAYRPSYNSANVKTTGDHLEKSSIKEVDSAIEELNQTGNLSTFYDEIRGEDSMLDANLGNSFGRKIGENSLGGGA